MKTLALIGLGRWGSRYLSAAENSSDFRIKYICSPHVEDKIFDKSKYISVDNYEYLSKNKDIDGVIISTPIETHYKIARYFLSKKNNVLVEKPIAQSLFEVNELYDIAKENSRILITDYIYLYNSAFKLLKANLYKVGEISSIKFLLGNADSSVQDSALWQWGPHILSMIYYLLDGASSAGEISAKVLKNKNIGFTIKLKSGIKIFTEIGYDFDKKMRLISINGKSGSINFDEISQKKIMISLSGEIKIFPKYDNVTALENLLNYFCQNLNKQNDSLDIDLFVTNALEKLDMSLKKDGRIQAL